MSNSSITEFGRTLSDPDGPLARVESGLAQPVKQIAFWAAIVLPFLHVPLVLATGLATVPTAAAFVLLLAFNVLALLVGHAYEVDRA
jgi:hypothetical protein